MARNKLPTPDYSPTECDGWQWWWPSANRVWIIAPWGDAGSFDGAEFAQIVRHGWLVHGTLAAAIEEFFKENF